jgi:cold shock protein
MGRGRDFRGGGSSRGRRAHDEDQGVFLEPTALYSPNLTARRSFTSDGNPVAAVVKWFNPEKGCGFLEIADGSGDAFLPIKALQALGRDTVLPGATLNVFVAQGEKGRYVTKITAVEDSGKSSMPANGISSAVGPRRGEALSAAKDVPGKVKWFSVEKGMGFMLASASFFLSASLRERVESLAATRRRQGLVVAGLLNSADGPEQPLADIHSLRR